MISVFKTSVTNTTEIETLKLFLDTHLENANRNKQLGQSLCNSAQLKKLPISPNNT